MKLSSKTISHDGLSTPEWENITTKWYIIMDLQDDFQGNTTLWDKFKYVNVEQRKYLNQNDRHTWFKGSRTNTFCPDTKDKHKKKVVEMINTFLLSIEEPLIQPYIDVLSFEYIEQERLADEEREKNQRIWNAQYATT
jgi:hypothetical protein